MIISKRTSIEQAVNRAQLVASAIATLLETKPDKVAVVNYKLSFDRDSQMSRLKKVEQHENKKHKHNWKKELQLSNEYVGHRDQFLKMLTEFQSM